VVHGDDLARVQKRLPYRHCAPLDFTFQRECVTAVTHGDIPILEVITDALPGERVKRQDAVTYPGLLLSRKAQHDEPVANVNAKLVTTSPPGCMGIQSRPQPLGFRWLVWGSDIFCC
jgi:hypothetical protein